MAREAEPEAGGAEAGLLQAAKLLGAKPQCADPASCGLLVVKPLEADLLMAKPTEARGCKAGWKLGPTGQAGGRWSRSPEAICGSALCEPLVAKLPYVKLKGDSWKQSCQMHGPTGPAEGLPS